MRKRQWHILKQMLEMDLLGYMAGRTGNVIRFIPPLDRHLRPEIEKALEIMEVSMGSVYKMMKSS